MLCVASAILFFRVSRTSKGKSLCIQSGSEHGLSYIECAETDCDMLRVISPRGAGNDPSRQDRKRLQKKDMQPIAAKAVADRNLD